VAKAVNIPKIIALLTKADREAQVEDAYMKICGATELERPYGCDGLDKGILFEFKLDEKLDGLAGMKTIAQSAYYVHHLVTNGVYKDKIYQPPTTVAICDKNQSICFPTARFEKHIHDTKFDWTRPASSPDPKLIADVARDFADIIIYNMTTEPGVQAFQDSLSQGEVMLQQITHENFDRIFEEWRLNFAPDKEPQEAALAFLLDLQMQGIKDEASGRIVLRCEVATGGTTKYFDIRVPITKYETFWSTYDRPPSNSEMAKIIERKDRLVVMQLRRTTGEFFTPLPYAALAHEYLTKSIPDRYEGNGVHHSMYDDFNWWDPACGTGNLTLDCPPTMQGKLFMSTLNKEDVDVILNAGQNPNATVFQYDFLNQGDDELPEDLQEALKDGKPWVFILNPPYAGGTGLGMHKKDCSDTLIVEQMQALKLAHACQNPMTQFVFRIQQLSEQYNLETSIGLFSKALLWTGTGLGAFRQLFRQRFTPTGGFCFHCSEFQGTSGSWPIVYTIWKTEVTKDEVVIDILDGPDTITGAKTFSPAGEPLSKWVDRPKATIVRPPMNGALGTVEREQVSLDKTALDSIAYLRWQGSDVQHSTSLCFILSEPYQGGHGWSTTPENFFDSMVAYSARKLVKQTWLNDKDEFSVPNIEHQDYDQWALDAIVWSLFHGSNNTSSLGNITYKKENYDIPNHFFWMTPAEMMEINNLPRPIWQQCRTATTRFVSKWIQGKTFSEDAAALLELGKDLVVSSAPHRMDALPKFQLDRWDAGWYQIRMGLFGSKDVPFQQPIEMVEKMEQFKVAHKELGNRLRPMIYELGFLPTERMVEKALVQPGTNDAEEV